MPIATGARLRGPFVSPDGQWVGFFEGLTLKKVRMTGGPPITLAKIDATGPRGATWATNDTIVMATNSAATGLLLVPYHVESSLRSQFLRKSPHLGGAYHRCHRYVISK